MQRKKEDCTLGHNGIRTTHGRRVTMMQVGVSVSMRKAVTHRESDGNEARRRLEKERAFFC